jgi:GNAT superfamily N-acetyltransferase
MADDAPARHPVVVRPAGDLDRDWVRATLLERWGSPVVVSRGRAHRADGLPALVAVRRDERAGLATTRLDGDELELVTLDALVPGVGVGSALLYAVLAVARDAGCRRVWLTTSNDNLEALRFYQRRGLRIVAVHRGAIDRARELKATIPLVGRHGIEIHDEIELAIGWSASGASSPQRSGSGPG